MTSKTCLTFSISSVEKSLVISLAILLMIAFLFTIYSFAFSDKITIFKRWSVLAFVFSSLTKSASNNF